MIQYKNGNALVSLQKNGTRTIEYEDTLLLEYPLNIDITTFSYCSLHTVCKFCHVSAKEQGKEADYQKLQEKLHLLPPGIELAIAANDITEGLYGFLKWSKDHGLLCNLTVNQLHIPKYHKQLIKLQEEDLFKGIGISYRSNNFKRSEYKYWQEYEHSVLHCIAGLDSIDDIVACPFKKVLVLGYKIFGKGDLYYSENKYKIDQCIKEWNWWVPKLFAKHDKLQSNQNVLQQPMVARGKDLVSFDNLAIIQLKIERFFTKENWDIFYQGEHSFYIDAVDEYYSPSSRSPLRKNWDKISVLDYFKTKPVSLIINE